MTSLSTPQSDPSSSSQIIDSRPLPRSPLLCKHYLDYRNPMSSPLMTSISVMRRALHLHRLGVRATWRAPLLRHPPVPLPGFSFTTTGRPLGLHPLDPSPTSGGGPDPRRKRPATQRQRQHRSFRPSTIHGLNAPCLHSSTPAPCPTPPHLRSSVDAPMGLTHMPLHHLLPLGFFSDP